MRKFEVPIMRIQRLEKEDFMMTSGCYLIYTCEDCYCAIVTCASAYSCSGLKCMRYTHGA